MISARSAAPAFGPVVLRDRWRKMLKAGKDIETLDVPSLHALRLRAKRARYAAEMFAFLDDGRSTQRAIRRVSALQQALGMLNDGAVAAHLLEELGGPGGRHGYAVGLVLGFIAARAGRIHAMDTLYLLGLGPRIAHATRDLAMLFHPGADLPPLPPRSWA